MSGSTPHGPLGKIIFAIVLVVRPFAGTTLFFPT